MNLNIVFAGTPEFAAKHLQAMANACFSIVAVFTQPDKPSGRGHALTAPPVKILAEQLKIPVFQPATLKQTTDVQKLFRDLNAQVVIDVAYGLIIPNILLTLPHYGFINAHPSLLPRWRGPAPIQHAILSGDTETGITIMQLDSGIDTGPIYLQKRCLISSTDTTCSLSNKLAILSCEALIEVLNNLDSMRPIPQPKENICYAHKVEKEMARIDWEKPAIVLDREIRAYNPWPIAYAQIGDERLRIYQARPLLEGHSHAAGKIVQLSHDSLIVATGEGLLEILTAQFPGGKILPIANILNSKKSFFESYREFRL